MSAHLTSEALAAWAEGVEPGSEEKKHVEACVRCGQALDAWRHYIAARNSLRSMERPVGRARRLQARREAESAGPWRKWVNALFLPWRRKIPLELAAAGLAVLLLVLVWPGRRAESSGAWVAQKPLVYQSDEAKDLPAFEKAQPSAVDANKDLAETPEPPKPPEPTELGAMLKKSAPAPLSGSASAVLAEQEEAAPPINGPAVLIQEGTGKTPDTAGSFQLTAAQDSLLRTLGFRRISRGKITAYILKTKTARVGPLHVRLQAFALDGRCRVHRIPASDSVRLEIR